MICARCGAPDAAPLDTAAAPTCAECGSDPRLDGRYALARLLGQGTHGMTYRAIAPDGGAVAIKMVNLGHGLDPSRRAALDREVAVLRGLDHPRIPAMLDDFTARSGMTRYRCIVQTFIDGADLLTAARERRPSVREVMAWVAEIADVLAWLHGLAPPIIHRDIKPQNVLRRRSDGALVLIDFGSVRDTVVETLGGTLGVGTAGYMAPEQIVGDVGPASDLYGLGAMTIELLTHTPPHALRERGGRLVWPSASYPPAVAALVDRLVDPDPARRPASAAAVRDEARRLAEDPEQPSGMASPDATAPTGSDVTPLALPIPAMVSVANIDPTRPESSHPWESLHASDLVARAEDATAIRHRALAWCGLSGPLVAIAGFIAFIQIESIIGSGPIAALLGIKIAREGKRAGLSRVRAIGWTLPAVAFAVFAAINLLAIGTTQASQFIPHGIVLYAIALGWQSTRAARDVRELPTRP